MWLFDATLSRCDSEQLIQSNDTMM